MTFGLLDPKTIALVQMMGGGVPSLTQDVNQMNMQTPVPQNFSLLSPMLLAGLDPSMMDDQTLFSQNFDDLSNDEIRAIEAEQIKRNERLIEQRQRDLENNIELYRGNVLREDMI